MTINSISYIAIILFRTDKQIFQMCGRFSITKQEEEIEKRFGAKFYSDKFEPEFNAYPTKNIPIITNENPNYIKYHRWGLTYNWTTKPIINSRSDKLAKSPVFKKLFQFKRCIIPADGFYEWRKMKIGGKDRKIPYRIRLKDDSLFAFAGLWDLNTNEIGNTEIRFSIITTEPNNIVKEIHNRMPVIMKPESEKLWLSNETSISELDDLLLPIDEDDMEAYEISPLVNNPDNNFRDILIPVNKE